MNELPSGAGPVLIALARQAIATKLRLSTDPAGETPTADWLNQLGASFVTLTINQALRGCIGSLTAYRSLRDDVCDNAVSAAFYDPRFSPLSTSEFDDVDIEVSVLSPPRPLDFTSKEDALSKLRPHVDGVVLMAGARRATFLPQVWEDLPDPKEFIRHLLYKAGLGSDYWDDHVRIETYTVTAFQS